MRFDRTLGRLTVDQLTNFFECVRLTAPAVRFLSSDDPVRRSFNA